MEENRSKLTAALGMTGHKFWEICCLALMGFGSVVAIIGTERSVTYFIP